MKKLVTILAVALVSIGVFAQSPQTMSYQAVVRNSSNALVASTTIGVQISILQKSSTGDPVYIEKHSTTTNANGLATIEIGGGTPVSGRFETIDWSSGPFFLKTETDPTGGSNYSISGTSKLLSVPYALYAEKSGKSGSVEPWLTEGNSLTTVGTNFLGTIDSQPLMFKVYNKEAGYIDFDYNKANTGFGFQTLSSNTTGHSNTANGYEALQSNTTGVQNSAIGKLALSANTEGNNNIALGSEALSYNTSGSFNVAAGTSTMRYNTTGNYNTANGIWSLYNNNKGSYNSAYGTSALVTNIDGNNNTAIGFNADVLTGSLKNATAIGNGAKANTSNEVRIGNKEVSSLYFGTANNLATTPDLAANMYYDFTTGQIMRSTAAGNDSGNHWTLIGNGGAVSDANFIGTTTNVPFNIKVNNEKAGRIDQFLFNTFFGYQSGNAGPTGKWNTAVGNIALRDNTTGHDNTAIGDEALTFNTTGNSVTAIGESALFHNTTGSENTATGYSSLGSNTSGFNNTANGVQSLFTNTTGGFNTANGAKALYSTTASRGNTALGAGAGDNNVNNGSSNTFLGFNAVANVDDISNSTALGTNAIVTENNKMILGDNSIKVGIGLSGISPGPGNKLEINSAITDASGLRFRKLTSLSATVSPNPGKGVLAVDINGDVIYVATGTSASSAHTIGQVYGGGTVFYVCDNGQHGLIAAPADQSTSMRWNNGVNRITGTTGDGLFAGAMNTTLIVATQIGDPLAGDFAAKVCADYSVTTGGVTYGDWYLPSKYELNLLYLSVSSVSGIAQAYYWCSSEVSAQTGNVYGFDNLTWSIANKSDTYHVRAVRAF